MRNCLQFNDAAALPQVHELALVESNGATMTPIPQYSYSSQDLSFASTHYSHTSFHILINIPLAYDMYVCQSPPIGRLGAFYIRRGVNAYD